MEIVTSKDEVMNMIESHDMVFVYFSGKNCNVCHAVKPKVKDILTNYPNIKTIEVEVENSVEISAQFNIFTVPAILLFIERKEVIRELRHISLLELENKIERYYHLFY